MVKQRMGTLDVVAETACLRQRLLGMRLANAYDVDAKVTACAKRVNVCAGLLLLLSLMVPMAADLAAEVLQER